MKPRNKTEIEVLALSSKLPLLSDKQRAWAISKCTSEQDAYRWSNRTSRGSFYLACTFRGWQVLRYFQVFVKYRYHKITDRIIFKECMQQWMKDGSYVFLAKHRRSGYYSDAFCEFSPMEVRNNTCYGMLGDPRLLGWDGVYIASLQRKYKYALQDFKKKVDFDNILRAVNAHPYNETLMRKDLETWKACQYHGAIFDHQLMCAVKVVIRHKKASYLYDSLWWDMIDSLRYMKKDLHNPAYICPEQLQKAHDYWLSLALSRKKKMSDRMTKLRQIQEEKRQLAYIEEQARREEENKKRAKSIARIYVAKRKPFFDIDITDGVIHVKVLKTVDEFFEEGKEMHHCVFSNRYYDVCERPNCLILSATVNGQRMETIEIDLSTLKIIQCQGKYNQNSPFHDAILKLVENNSWQIESRIIDKKGKTA